MDHKVAHTRCLHTVELEIKWAGKKKIWSVFIGSENELGSGISFSSIAVLAQHRPDFELQMVRVGLILYIKLLGLVCFQRV